MVHLQHGVIQGQAFHPIFQFFIKDHAALVQILVVDSHGKYEMAEDIFRYAVSPGHFHPCTKRAADIVEIQLPVVIRNIPDRHIGIQESKRLFFVRCHLLVEDGKKIPVRQSSLLCLEIFFNFGTKRIVRNEMLLLIA